MPLHDAAKRRLSFTKRLILATCIAMGLSACAATGPSQDNAAAPLGLDSSLRLANATFAGGDVNSALRLYRRAVQEFPDSAGARQGLADAYYRIRAYPEAKVTYEQLGELAPGSPAYLIGLGRVALASGDVTAAEDAFVRALALDPAHPEALNGQAVALDLAGDHAAAQSIYQDVLRRDPTNRAVMNNLALSLALAGEHEQAINQLVKLVDGPAVIPEARHNLALTHALRGDEQTAYRLIREAMSPAAVDSTMAFYRRLPRESQP